MVWDREEIIGSIVLFLDVLGLILAAAIPTLIGHNKSLEKEIKLKEMEYEQQIKLKEMELYGEPRNANR